MPRKIYGYLVPAVLIFAFPPGYIAGISVRIWLIYALTAAGAVLFLKERKSPAGGKQRRPETLDCLLLIFLVWNILILAAECLQGKGCDETVFLFIASTAFFFLVSAGFGYPRRYREFFTVCTALMLIVRILSEPDGQKTASFFLPAGLLAMSGYCETKDAWKRTFYMAAALADFFFLFSLHDAAAVLLMAAGIALYMIFRVPEKRFIQKSMQIAFSFFFLLANMSLIEGYILTGTQGSILSLEDSVYLELALSIAGVAFFSWWDKLPEDETAVYPAFTKTIQFILVCAGIICFMLLLPGGIAEDAEKRLGADALLRMKGAVQASMAQGGGTFWKMLERYGAAGCIWLACIVPVIAEKIRKKYKSGRGDACLLAITVLYLLQSVFYGQQMASTPLYVLFAAMALHGNSERKVISQNG